MGTSSCDKNNNLSGLRSRLFRFVTNLADSGFGARILNKHRHSRRLHAYGRRCQVQRQKEKRTNNNKKQEKENFPVFGFGNSGSRTPTSVSFFFSRFFLLSFYQVMKVPLLLVLVVIATVAQARRKTVLLA